MSNSNHRHTPRTTITRCFSGPIPGAKENRVAHGNVVHVATCSCGATRSTNVNGGQREQGRWVDDE